MAAHSVHDRLSYADTKYVKYLRTCRQLQHLRSYKVRSSALVVLLRGRASRSSQNSRLVGSHPADRLISRYLHTCHAHALCPLSAEAIESAV